MLAVTRTVAEPSDVVMEGVETFSGAGPGQRDNDVSEIVAPLGRDAFDPARILQVLCNLLSNAITFTAAQGRVVLRVEHVDEDVVFSVSDRGDDS